MTDVPSSPLNPGPSLRPEHTDRAALAEQVATTMRTMAARGLIAATDGNVSARYGDDSLLVTPSGRDKASLRGEDIIEVDLEGRLRRGEGSASSEIAMHLACYRARPDVRAVVHAHPVTAVAITLAGSTILEEPIIPEMVTTVGGVPTIPYSTPTTEGLAAAVAPYAARCDVMMLESHGSVCLGHDLRDAWMKLDKLEHSAETLWRAAAFGGARRLDDDEVGRLLEIRVREGFPGPNWLLSRRQSID